MMKRIMPQTAGMRRAGSAALDLSDVARGRFEAFWELWLNPWDLAAGVLLVREAGGRVTDLEGNDARLIGGTIVASNGVLHDWFLDTLNNA
jgi:myo-inositol-1(or 4)-monophosphatase